LVGLCDLNPKRAEAGRQLIGVDCPSFTSFEQMCEQARPELVGVTTEEDRRDVDERVDVGAGVV
jgi:predicted dehydrogenase